jgi:hypothetical protein
MSKLYFVSSEHHGILNPGERGFRSLEKAQALAAKAAEECSWECQTPPSPDNESSPGRGNFRCGVLSAHGIHIREDVDGFWGEEYDVPEEKFHRAKATRQADWILQYVIDRGTDYLGDGEDSQFYTGPEQTEDVWDSLLDDIAGGDEIVEATVTPLQHGRYWHLMDEDGDYPLVWEQGHGFR